jgi:LacI family transcriptional regulator
VSDETRTERTLRTRTHARSNMKEVADLAGVALSSVSRVLSGHPDVSEPMRERVMQAVERLGYQPDLLAQSMRRRSTLSCGFVVGDISNPLLAEIAQGAEVTLRDAGYAMLLTNSENDPRLDASHVRLFLQRRVDCLLLSLAAETDRETLALLERIEEPIVVIDRDVPEEIGAGAVLSDHRTGMHAAVSHLLDLGHRRIGLVNGATLRAPRERRAGLEDAYRDRGLPADYRILEGPLTVDHGQRATAELLDGPEPPTAIVAGANQLLVGTLRELRRRNSRIGSDLSLVSCDTIVLTELFDPPIAVVDRDNRELGRQAAAMLLERMSKPDTPPERITLPTRFIARPSCAPPPPGA